jgi:hypothetical protein
MIFYILILSIGLVLIKQFNCHFSMSIGMFKDKKVYIQAYPFDIDEDFFVFKYREKVIPIYTKKNVFEERGIRVLRAFISNFTHYEPNCVLIFPKVNIFFNFSVRYFNETIDSMELPSNISYPMVKLLKDDPEAHHQYTDNELIVNEEYEEYFVELNKKAEWFLDFKMRNSNLKLLSNGPKVFLTMTVSPERLIMLHYVLSSMSLDLVTSIFITLPRLYKGKQAYTIPRKLVEEFPKIIYLSEEWDYGPISKIASSVQHVYENYDKNMADESIFISIDDDQRYSDRMVDTLVYFAFQNPQSIITASTCNFLITGTFGLPIISIETSSPHPHLNLKSELEGYAGVAYRGKFVDYKLMKYLTDYRNNPKLFPCYMSDDVVISRVLMFRNVPILEIDPKYINNFYTRHERKDFPNSRDENALQFTNSVGLTNQGPSHFEKYMKCHATLISYLLDSNLQQKFKF